MLNDRLKQIAIDTVTFMLVFYLDNTYEKIHGLGMLILPLLAVNPIVGLFHYAKLQYGCIAQADGDYLYINSKRIAIAHIAAIERQTICSKRYGINIKMRDGKFRSFQFGQLVDEQINDLVLFLSAAISGFHTELHCS